MDTTMDYHITPGIEIKGVFYKFPLSDKDCESISMNAEWATFGEGGERKVDFEVRKSRTMDESQFNIIGFRLPTFANAVLKFRSINIYEKGGFFKRHVDSNKNGAREIMVACLPSKFKGGELNTFDEQYTFDFYDDEDGIRVIYFPIDEPHEALPVLEGWKITLTYDVIPTDYASGGGLEERRWDPEGKRYYRVGKLGDDPNISD
jgi:hypothetical protein